MNALIIICGLGLLAMFSEIFKFRQALFPIVILGVLAALVLNIWEWNHPMHIVYFDNMISFDRPALAFSTVILSISLLWFLLAQDYFKAGQHMVDHYALVLFAIVGALMLAGCTNMTTLFLGIETLSIPMYVLAASKKNDYKSNEAGFKYLIMGSFASGFLLFGVALVYGATGSFDFATIQSGIISSAELPLFYYAGIILILIAMAFKVAVAPFHFWAPDVYEGSPALITALMSTVVKTAAFAAFMRLFMICFADINEVWINILAVLVALSLAVSNFTAVLQTNTKRMLAYSSISHAAFMLMIIMSDKGDASSVNSLIYYTVAYSLASLVAFGVVYLVSKTGSEELTELNGLNKRNKFLAIALTVALLSLAGIPVTAGFFAKYFVLSQIPSETMLWLTVLAIISSTVAAFYYVKIVGNLFFAVGRTEEPIVVERIHVVVLLLCVLLLFLVGVIPGLITELKLV